MPPLELAAKILIGLTLLTPLVVLPDHFLYPFVFSKVLFFRSLVEILLGVWVLLWAGRRGAYGVSWTPISKLVGVFLLSLGLSTAVGVDWYRSLWDTHARMLGGVTLLHYGAYYFAVTSIVEDQKTWRALLFVFLVVGFVVGVIGVAQWFSPGLLHSEERIGSTLGDSTHIGAFSLFTIFLSLLVGLQEKRPWVRCFCAASGILACSCILLSQTRGALVALGAGVVAGLLCAIVGVRRPRVRLALGGLLALWCLCGVLLVAVRESPTVRELPVIGRLADISLTTQTAVTRTMAWGVALEAARDRPLLGWGPCNFYYAFNQHYRPKFADFAETWWDQAHNVPLNVLVTQGTVGLLIYLCLMGSPVVLVWRVYRRGACRDGTCRDGTRRDGTRRDGTRRDGTRRDGTRRDGACRDGTRPDGACRDGPVPRYLAVLTTALLVAHCAHTFFAFEDPTSCLYLMFFFAFLNRRFLGEMEATPAVVPVRPWLTAVGITVVVGVVTASIWFANVVPGRASYLGAETFRALHGEHPAAALETLERSESLSSPHHAIVRLAFAEGVLKTSSRRPAAASGQEIQQLLLKAYDVMKKNTERAPRDVRSVIVRAKLAQALWARFQLREPVAEMEGALDSALEHSPRRQELLFAVSANKLDNGKREESIALLERSIDNDALAGEGWWRLALLYEFLGRRTEARELLEEAEQRAIRFDARQRELVDRILR